MLSRFLFFPTFDVRLFVRTVTELAVLQAGIAVPLPTALFGAFDRICVFRVITAWCDAECRVYRVIVVAPQVWWICKKSVHIIKNVNLWM